ncbi:hypothetical protein CU097_010707, partial [Rhizopus azygosporus]
GPHLQLLHLMRTSQQPYDTHIGPILILLMELVLRLYAALSEQCPDAISTVPVQQGSHHNELAPLLTNVLNLYDYVLHVELLLNPQTDIFFGKGYVLLNISTDDIQSIKSLGYEIALAEHSIEAIIRILLVFFVLVR